MLFDSTFISVIYGRLDWARLDCFGHFRLIRYEQTTRPESQRSASWIELQQGKIDRALAVIEAAPPAGERDVGHLATACALGYLDYRFGGAWRAGAPKLVAWLEAFMRDIPSFAATMV